MTILSIFHLFENLKEPEKFRLEYHLSLPLLLHQADILVCFFFLFFHLEVALELFPELSSNWRSHINVDLGLIVEYSLISFRENIFLLFVVEWILKWQHDFLVKLVIWLNHRLWKNEFGFGENTVNKLVEVLNECNCGIRSRIGGCVVLRLSTFWRKNDGCPGRNFQVLEREKLIRFCTYVFLWLVFGASECTGMLGFWRIIFHRGIYWGIRFCSLHCRGTIIWGILVFA